VSGLRQPAPDYSAPPGAPYTAEDVSILIRPSEGDSFHLGATLTLPASGRGPFPVLVTISGSGAQNRDEELWPVVVGYRPFRQIAERLALEGIAVLRYDDRGVGASGGPPGTTADFADDVRQLVAWLRARPGVDGSRIALLGHSEGAVIAPLVAAADARIRAVVLMAGPSANVAEAVRYQLRYALENNDALTAEERASRLLRVDQDVEEWARSNPWARWLASYDPLPTAARMRQAVLILHGALDRQVTVGQADTLAAAIRRGGNRDVTVRIWPRLNHLFLYTDAVGAATEYATLRDKAVPAEVLDTLALWLRERVRAGR
jgi:alpha-beta hydrolase superfamily lysophospholipase